MKKLLFIFLLIPALGSAWGKQVPESLFPVYDALFGNTHHMSLRLFFNDAGLESIDLPAYVCADSLEVLVTVRNYGTSDLDSCMVNWEIDGVVQSPLRFIGPLSPFGSPGSHTAQISLGKLFLPSGTSKNLKVYTSLPNGGGDAFHNNDTLSRVLTPSLGGTYTIDANHPTGGRNYNSFASAISALSTTGVCAPVVFKVVTGSGPYNEQVTLGAIPGASAINTVTFDGGSTKERIFNGSTTGGNRHVIRLNGARHITLKNLRIENTATLNAVGVHLLNQADSNTIEGCVVRVNNSATPTQNAPVGGIVASQTSTTSFLVNGNPANYTTIRNCEVDGGWVNVIFVGPSTANHNQGNRIENCVLRNAFTFSIALYDQDEVDVIGNKITMRSGVVTGFGIYSYYNDNLDIIGNTLLNFHVRGFYIERTNSNIGSGNGLTRIVNNMISNDPARPTPYCNAIHLSSVCYDVKVWHNSVSLPGGLNSVHALHLDLASSSAIDIRNNSFAVFRTGSNNLAAYFSNGSTSAVSHFDYNNYYGPNSNLVMQLGTNTYGASNITSGGGAHSYFGNPNYLNNIANLHAQTTQLSNRADSTVNLAFDIDGDPRPAGNATTSDIGADEFDWVPVQLTLEGFSSPVSECGLTDSTMVSLRFRNAGYGPVSNVSLTYVLNGGTPVTETYTSVVGPNQVATYQFSTPANMQTTGTYTLDGWLSAAADSFPADDSAWSYTLQHVPEISSFPYLEDFENGPGGWHAEGGAEWELGTPAGVEINSAASGSNAWVTDLDGSYENNACGALLSPCFDFSNLVEPTVSMALWWEAESGWDGALLEYSTDNGMTWSLAGSFGDPNNWYTDDGIAALQGCTSQGAGWTGSEAVGDGSGGWVQAERVLPQLAGESSVRFRLFFGSDATVGSDGVGFDDFAVRDLPPVDVGAVSLVFPSSGACGDSNAIVGVIIENYGSQPQTQIPVSVRIDTNGVQYDLVSTVYTDTLAVKSNALVVVGTLNTYAGGAFQPTVYTAQSGDADISNDTVVGSLLLINETPGYPAVAGGNQQVLCEPGSLLLQVVRDSNLVYNWYASATASQALASDTLQFMTSLLSRDTSFYLEAVNSASGCVGPRTRIEVLLSQLSPVNLGSDTTLCPGTSLVLDAGNPGASFSWSTGAAGQTETVTRAGTYSVIVTDALGCDVGDSIQVDEAPANIVAFASQQAGNTLTVNFSNSSSGWGNLSYLWDFGDGNTSVQENPSHIYSAEGEYTVCLSVTDNCGMETLCDTVEVMVSSALDDGLLAGAIRLFPNPTDKTVYVTISGLDADVEVAITDMTGRAIANRSIMRFEQDQAIEFDLAEEAEGVYLVRFEAEGRRLLRKVVLER